MRRGRGSHFVLGGAIENNFETRDLKRGIIKKRQLTLIRKETVLILYSLLVLVGTFTRESGSMLI